MENTIMQDVMIELKIAKRKFPNFPDHPAAQAGIICKESGQLMQTCLQRKYEAAKLSEVEHFELMYKEAVQTAAAAIRFLENLKKTNHA